MMTKVMASNGIFAVAIAISVGTAQAESCTAGYTFKSNLTGLYCYGAATAVACGEAACCAVGTDTCLGATNVTCDEGEFKDAAKNGATAGTTAAEKKTSCCTAKASCSTLTCPAGYADKTDKANLTCAGASCTEAADTQSCCQADTAKCAGAVVSCDQGMFKDPAKYGVTAGADAAAKESNCCTAKAACSTFTCPAGYMDKTNAASLNCTGAPCTDAADTNQCCQPDPAKCRGAVVSCGESNYKDSTKWGEAAGTSDADKKTNCCSAKATCAAFSSMSQSGAVAATSVAPKAQTPVMALVFAVLAVLAWFM